MTPGRSVGLRQANPGNPRDGKTIIGSEARKGEKKLESQGGTKPVAAEDRSCNSSGHLAEADAVKQLTRSLHTHTPPAEGRLERDSMVAAKPRNEIAAGTKGTLGQESDVVPP